MIMNSIASVKNEEIKIPKTMLFISITILIILVTFIVFHFADVEKFVVLLSHAEPKWLLLAILLQIGTYICAGLIWYLAIKTAQHKIPLKALARLSIEKLSIDQLIPMGGMSGNLMVLQTMKRFGLPDWLSVEALLVDILSHYLSFALMAFLSWLILWFYHDLTTIIRYLISIFSIIVIMVPIVIFWLLIHKDRQIPICLLKFRFINNIYETVKAVSAERVLKIKLLGMTSLLSGAIFLLDAATLWIMMRIINHPVEMLTALVTIVIASIAGAVSFLPGGIGGFETGSVMVLSLFGVPVEAALTGTLLLRGFTLWLPLIPGILLARHDVKIKI